MVTLACDLDVLGPSIPTSLAAIFLARRYFTKTRDMRALGLLLICHLQFPPLQFPFLFVSIRNLYCVTIHCIRLSKRGDSLRCKLFFTISPATNEKTCPRRDTQSACGRARNDFAAIWESRTPAPMEPACEPRVFPVLRCLAPSMLCHL